MPLAMTDGALDQIDEFSKAARKLAHLKLSPLQCEILRELLEGSRTSSELTDSIFHSTYRDDDFPAYHARTVRAVRSLEARGLISKKKLLGREKPYGLTHHGAVRVASILPEMKDPVVVSLKDGLLFAVALLIGVLAQLTGSRQLVDFFWLLLGMTLVRSAQILRKVI